MVEGLIAGLCIVGILSLGAVCTSVGTFIHVRKYLSVVHEGETGMKVTETQTQETFQRQNTEVRMKELEVEELRLQVNKMNPSPSQQYLDLSKDNKSKDLDNSIMASDFTSPSDQRSTTPNHYRGSNSTPEPPVSTRFVITKQYIVRTTEKDSTSSETEETRNGLENNTSKIFAEGAVTIGTSLITNPIVSAAKAVGSGISALRKKNLKIDVDGYRGDTDNDTPDSDFTPKSKYKELASSLKPIVKSQSAEFFRGEKSLPSLEYPVQDDLSSIKMISVKSPLKASKTPALTTIAQSPSTSVISKLEKPIIDKEKPGITREQTTIIDVFEDTMLMGKSSLMSDESHETYGSA